MAVDCTDRPCRMRFGKGRVLCLRTEAIRRNRHLPNQRCTSEPKFIRYNNLRKEKQFLQTCAPSYGWLKAAIKMSWYLRYHGWKKLQSPLLIFQAEKRRFRIRPRTSEICSKSQEARCCPLRVCLHAWDEA